jgi:putative ABC transport system permease protein
MYFLTYLRRELRRRMRQAVLTALGLAVGIGLVVTVTAASAGVTNAQGAVLHALYGIGTDVTITTAMPPPKPGSMSKFGFSPGNAPQTEDLLGLPPGLGVLAASSVTSVSRLRDVAATAGGLTLMDTKLTVPSQAQAQAGRLPPSAFGTTLTVDGVDLTHLGLGPLGSGTVSSGRNFAASDGGSHVAVVDSRYATANRLRVGSTVTIAKVAFKIIGIISQSQDGGSTDVYIPLERAQALAQFQGSNSLVGKVDTIYVVAASSSDIPAVRAAIARLLPGATVTSSGNLAGEVSGSLAGAASLANDLGRWLAIAVLLAAFAVASLLTLAAVARRVREFGTLKALGWSSGRIVAQVMGESVVVGVVGAVVGIALGFGGSVLIDRMAPKLSATVAQNPGSSPARGIQMNSTGFHQPILPGAEHTIAVHMSAPVTVSAIVLAVVLALSGALIAGSFGGWRTARLRPAEALAQV